MSQGWNQKANKKYFEIIENEQIACYNVWDTAKSVLRRKYIAINAYIKKEGTKSTIQGKEEETKSKVDRRKRITEWEYLKWKM